MVENSKDDTEGTFAQFLNDFVPVVDVVVVANVVFLLVCVEAMVGCFVDAAPFCAASHRCFFSFPLQSFLVIKIVDRLVI
jgi:adenine C2-methylase RlmN of 23S rRNA A2503 and tRNA A37